MDNVQERAEANARWYRAWAEFACSVCNFEPSDDCPRTECPRHDDNSCGRCGHTPSRCVCLKPAENE